MSYLSERDKCQYCGEALSGKGVKCCDNLAYLGAFYHTKCLDFHKMGDYHVAPAPAPAPAPAKPRITCCDAFAQAWDVGLIGSVRVPREVTKYNWCIITPDGEHWDFQYCPWCGTDVGSA